MNPLVAVNIAAFAIVISLFAVETGVALLNLLDYDELGRKAAAYISKSWAFSGTFIIFYVVNLEVTYPSLLTPAGTIYISVLMAAGLLIIFRNTFIAYSEYVGDASAKRSLTMVYALATLLAVVVLLSALSSTVTGDGVSLSPPGLNYLAMFINPYNISMLVCALAVSLLAASMIFNINSLFGLGKPAICAILLVVVLVTFLYATSNVGFLVKGLGSRWYGLLPGIAALLAALFLYLSQSPRWLAKTAYAWLFVTVVGFELLGYPDIFGGAASLTSFLTSPSAMSSGLIITGVIVLVLIFGLGFLLYIGKKAAGRRAKGY